MANSGVGAAGQLGQMPGQIDPMRMMAMQMLMPQWGLPKYSLGLSPTNLMRALELGRSTDELRRRTIKEILGAAGIGGQQDKSSASKSSRGSTGRSSSSSKAKDPEAEQTKKDKAYWDLEKKKLDYEKGLLDMKKKQIELMNLPAEMKREAEDRAYKDTERELKWFKMGTDILQDATKEDRSITTSEVNNFNAMSPDYKLWRYDFRSGGKRGWFGSYDDATAYGMTKDGEPDEQEVKDSLEAQGFDKEEIDFYLKQLVPVQ